jgi:hypothetical protein
LKRQEMFDSAFKIGADLHLKNRQKLTPLGLAAKLTRVQVRSCSNMKIIKDCDHITFCACFDQMFYHILTLQKEVYWQFCDNAFIAYPIEEIDSIDVHTGQVLSESALSVVVFGVRWLLLESRFAARLKHEQLLFQ